MFEGGNTPLSHPSGFFFQRDIVYRRIMVTFAKDVATAL